MGHLYCTAGSFFVLCKATGQGTFKIFHMWYKFSNNLRLSIVVSILLFIVVSCQKVLTGEVTVPVDAGPPISSEKIVTTVTGFVTNADNVAVMGAMVKAGEVTTITDRYGYFEIKNVLVTKEAAVVSVTQAGYFKGIKTWVAVAGKAVFFRLRLLPKTVEGSIQSSVGGTVSSQSGLSVTIPANAVINAATNNVYSGAVNVAIQWIDPQASDLHKIMPGDLRGINDKNVLKRLVTYGMAAVELTGPGGELLQLATGEKAILKIPLPASIAGTAPASIPLWYFDEVAGVWRQEGSASKNGNAYEGNVSHFSFWNCDIPSDYVYLSCSIVDIAGNPLAYATVKVSRLDNPLDNSIGYTNADGFVTGAIPGNTQIKIEILRSNCTGVLFEQLLSTGNSNINLNNLVIPAGTTHQALLTGRLFKCNNTPVTNGYVLRVDNGNLLRYDVDNNGEFRINTSYCGTTGSVFLIGNDNDAGEYSSTKTIVIHDGNNFIDTLKACGLSAEEYFNYTTDDSLVMLSPPAANVFQNGAIWNNITIQAINPFDPVRQDKTIVFNSDGIDNNSAQNLVYYSVYLDGVIFVDPVTVYITEYGQVNQFIAGFFSGRIILYGGRQVNMTCSFRVRRSQ